VSRAIENPLVGVHVALVLGQGILTNNDYPASALLMLSHLAPISISVSIY
jgi:hypothetical protein